ncbi:hypothetical protein NP233_g8668 [Leucocoprinus birnbaumii]|uniref:Cytochrome P450 n=1 Tax=Leucocoprinus birnbaumii TaxID=56174 RepID=A0AAD5YTI7_9AGAR|nr:hypothetical protein NP233_g8668 [Leucocoprinus birnbaumii]
MQMSSANRRPEHMMSERLSATEYSTQDHTHKNQRRVILRDIWSYKLKSGEEVIDGFAWLGKATLGVFGEAGEITSLVGRPPHLIYMSSLGFPYHFSALSGDPDHKGELYDTLAKMFDKIGAKSSLVPFLRGAFPTLSQWLPERQDNEAHEAGEVMYTIDRKLLEERKRDTSSSLEDDQGSRKDLLSVLVQSNVSEGVLNHLWMDDESVIAQVPTSIIAGHETTSTAMSRAVYCLTKHKSVQEKLRDEILIVPTDEPTVDQLNCLCYLEAAVRESLRLYAPASTTNRVAAEDVTVSLDNPVADVKGKNHDRIRIAKGPQTVVISPHLINTSKEIWGGDPSEFNPERWNSIPYAESVPGLWGTSQHFLPALNLALGTDLL